jgi:hypothetical protein
MNPNETARQLRDRAKALHDEGNKLEAIAAEVEKGSVQSQSLPGNLSAKQIDTTLKKVYVKPPGADDLQKKIDEDKRNKQKGQ